jgi:transposase-like protein
MDVHGIYGLFPDDVECIAYLEMLRWAGRPMCPYCNRRNSTPLRMGNRHHCNNCNGTFSVTAQTMFHGTRLPLQKWFLAIALLLTEERPPSARALAAQLDIDKNSAAFLLRRIREAESTQFDLMLQITEKIIGPEYRQKVAFARINLR